MRRAALISIVLTAFGCKTSDEAGVKDDEPEAADDDTTEADSSRIPAVDGTWSPILSLKDTTDTFKGTHEVPRPDGGWWVAPIHVNLLASGKILVTGWSRPKEDRCENHQGRLNGTSFLLDPSNLNVTAPATFAVTPLDESPKQLINEAANRSADVLYCSGHAPLPDGRILFMGGARYLNLGVAGFPARPGDPNFTQQEFGLPYARLFAPKTAKFTAVSPNNPGDPKPFDAASWKLPYEPGMMWYPTNTRLPGGKIMTNGGYTRWADVLDAKKWQYLNRSVTTFDVAAFDQRKNPWTILVHPENAPREVSNDVFDYPHALVLPKAVVINGLPRHVAIYGGIAFDPKDPSYQPGITFLSLDQNVPENQRFATPPHARRPNGGNASAGKMNESTAVLTATGEIMVMGGGNDGTREGQRIDVYTPGKDQWRSVDTGITRHKGASTLLPDGTVLIANGEEFFDTPRNRGDRRQVTIYNPKTDASTNLRAWSDDPDVRGYHNVSLLLKDGRVLIGGGRIFQNGGEGDYRIGCERPEVRVFSPPYLFKGPRPAFRGVAEPLQLKVGGAPVKITYSGPLLRRDGGVVLMALGAYTHSFDQNQRYVRLDFQQTSSGEVLVTPPASNQAAPEGEYNMFLVSDAGVPSLGAAVKVQ